MKPISPEEVNKSSVIPDFVIEVVNKLINKQYSKGSAIVTQEDIINAIIFRTPHITRDHIFDNKWLDFEELYREAGWKVVYDKPTYSEDYEPTFTFTHKNKK